MLRYKKTLVACAVCFGLGSMAHKIVGQAGVYLAGPAHAVPISLFRYPLLEPNEGAKGRTHGLFIGMYQGRDACQNLNAAFKHIGVALDPPSLYALEFDWERRLKAVHLDLKSLHKSACR